MKYQFRYVAPSPWNNLTYGVVLGAIFLLNHFEGQRLWSWITSRFTAFQVFVIGGFAFYLTVFWTLGVGYMLLDRYRRPAWLFRHRLQTPPPGEPDVRPGPSLGEAVRVVLFNQFFGTLPVLLLVYRLLLWRGLDMHRPAPSSLELARDLVVIVLVEEVLFYAVHWAMHRRALFRRFHHIHHRFRRSIGIATHYVHYVEHLFGNLVPIFAGALLLNAHVITIMVWVGMAVTNAIHTHSDYNFPWMSYAADHDFHHYQARGNYGAIGLLDRIFGTDREFRALAVRTKGDS